MDSRKDELIRNLGLEPLPREGGYFRFITKFGEGSGSIYYLMTETEFSHLHKLTSDELWVFLDGDEVVQTLVSPEGVVTRQVLNSENRVVNVKQGYFQATKINRIEKGYALVSTVMSPAYRDDMYTHGADVKWIRELEEVQEVL